MFPQERLEQVGEQLRAKISSKFTASTFLAGFALTVLTGQVFTLWQVTDLPPLFSVSVGAVVGALYLFIYAIIKLDELTMPKRFWRQTSQASMNGDSLDAGDLLTLHDRMIFFWRHLTIVATITTAAAVMGMLVPNKLCGVSIPVFSAMREHTFFAALVGVASACLYCWRIAAKADKLCGCLEISD